MHNATSSLLHTLQNLPYGVYQWGAAGEKREGESSVSLVEQDHLIPLNVNATAHYSYTLDASTSTRIAVKLFNLSDTGLGRFDSRLIPLSGTAHLSYHKLKNLHSRKKPRTIFSIPLTKLKMSLLESSCETDAKFSTVLHEAFVPQMSGC